MMVVCFFTFKSYGVLIMKPVVLLAQIKDLQAYLKTVQNTDLKTLVEINKRLLKMQLEVSEILDKMH